MGFAKPFLFENSKRFHNIFQYNLHSIRDFWLNNSLIILSLFSNVCNNGSMCMVQCHWKILILYDVAGDTTQTDITIILKHNVLNLL